MPFDVEKWEQEQIEKGHIPDKDGMWHYKNEESNQ